MRRVREHCQWMVCESLRSVDIVSAAVRDTEQIVGASVTGSEWCKDMKR